MSGYDASTGDAVIEMAVTDAPAEASSSPFTLLTGAADSMICEGDVCYVPGAVGGETAAEDHAQDAVART
ncbi:hypothetical protein ABIQ69_09090 [Agromyces sp. G08B096]|uniref:Uncharacterized protein n=1 Tax=Agromyces sp. G08B096 TaxID=3156399 RepID=A0AAU7W2V3_9MICO